jgi:murein DD-endopeptidase MepM/ murein hydrolase activator NlpD
VRSLSIVCSDVLTREGGTLRCELARHWRQVLAAGTASALVAGCTGGGETPSARSGSSDSLSGLAHINGAMLDSGPQAARSATAQASPPAAANGGVASRGPTVGASVPDTMRAITIPNPTPSTAGAAGVAPTPDELSALAASLVVPVAGVMPSELRSDFHTPRSGGARQHNALDIPAPRGTPVISATSGRVLRLFSSKAGGLMVYAADATERFILMYGHLDRYADGLADGMRLERGQTIGYVGTTGNAPPNVPHLHFAIARTNNVKRWWNGEPIDPAPLFKR